MKHTLALLIGLVLSFGGMTCAQSAIVSFTGLQFETVGTADVEAGGALNLQGLSVAQSSKGGAFTTARYDLAGNPAFSAFLEFSITRISGNGSDGMTFVIHDSPEGRTDLGFQGGGLGYYAFDTSNGIQNSVAVEFDTFRNTNALLNDPDDNHTGIGTNGDGAGTVEGTPAFSLKGDDGPRRFAWVDYDGTTMDVFLSETASKPGAPLVSRPLDLDSVVGDSGYLGFTGATGGGVSEHRVHQFTVSGLTVIPEPSRALLLLLGLGSVLARRRRP